MKDKVLIRDKKMYLKDNYYFTQALFGLVIVFIIYMTIMMTVLWFVDPSPISTNMDGVYYLKITDGDDNGNILIGDVYRLESLNDGGYHPTGKDNIDVRVSEFVYRQVDIGDIISLDVTDRGNYVYGGSIYPLVSPIYTVNGFVNFVIEIYLYLTAMFGISLICYIWNRNGSRIMEIIDFVPIHIVERWYGNYVCGIGCVDDKRRALRMEDTNLFLRIKDNQNHNTRIAGPLGKMYTIRSRITFVKDINEEIENILKSPEEE